jgi:hypothetical protein
VVVRDEGRVGAGRCRKESDADGDCNDQLSSERVFQQAAGITWLMVNDERSSWRLKRCVLERLDLEGQRSTRIWSIGKRSRGRRVPRNIKHALPS